MRKRGNKRFKISVVILALVVAVMAFVLTACGSSGGADQSASAASSSQSQGGNSGKNARSQSAQKALDRDVDNGYLILVNKEKGNRLPADYEPADLQRVSYVAEDRSPAGWTMRKEAAEQFDRLSEAAAADGINIVVTTAYRSYDFQKSLFTAYAARDGEEAASRYSARPGESEHQTGLTADLSTDEIDYANGSEYGGTRAGKWTAENCWKYGFIIRYPKDGEAITGYTYEPWHIRYVGKTAAKEIFDEGTTLEQYIEENNLGNSIPAGTGSDDGSAEEVGSAQ